jgi:predicted ATP-grasp superfamily ATP-dependent carboligase
MMMKPTVFILEGNFLGLEMARELRDAGYPVVVIGYSKNDIAIRAKGVTGRILPLPQQDSQSLLAGLVGLAGDIPGDRVLIGASDGYLRWVSHNREELSRQFKMLACPLEVMDALLDKWNQLQMAVSAGIAIPQSSILDENNAPANNVRFPAVVKARFSPKSMPFRDALGEKVIVVNTDEELRKACNRIIGLGFKPMIQKVIPGVDYNQFLFGASVKDGMPFAVCMAQKLKADPQPYGSGVMIRTIYHQELYDAGMRFLRQINYSGICDIEFMRNWDTGEFQFIEFNPRYGLGQRVSQMAGVSLAETAVQLAMGAHLGEARIARSGFYWVYFDEWAKERLAPWRNSFLRQLRNSNNTARIFDIGDCRPEIRHMKNIADLKLKRIIRN